MKKAAATAPKPKPAPKKQTQTTLKVTKKAAPKKRAVDSEDESSEIELNSKHDDDLLDDTPPQKKQKKAPVAKRAASKPLEEVENESFQADGVMDEPPAPKSAASKGGNSAKYQKVRRQASYIIEWLR